MTSAVMGSTPATLIAELARLHRPSGRRLGIVALPDVGERALQVAADSVEAHGSRAQRRLAVLQAAPGRQQVSAEEATYFLERFGHEYTVVLWPADRSDDAAVREAAERAGVAFVAVPLH